MFAIIYLAIGLCFAFWLCDGDGRKAVLNEIEKMEFNHSQACLLMAFAELMAICLWPIAVIVFVILALEKHRES